MLMSLDPKDEMLLNMLRTGEYVPDSEDQREGIDRLVQGGYVIPVERRPLFPGWPPRPRAYRLTAHGWSRVKRREPAPDEGE
jgi:hypothetical protein